MGSQQPRSDQVPRPPKTFSRAGTEAEVQPLPPAPRPSALSPAFALCTAFHLLPNSLGTRLVQPPGLASHWSLLLLSSDPFTHILPILQGLVYSPLQEVL